MTKTQKIFWIIFGLYMLFNFILSLIIDHNENNLEFLIGMKRFLSLGKYFAFFGLLMFIGSFFVSRVSGNKLRRENKELETESNELKARLFDMQESAKNVEIAEPKQEPPVG